MSKEVFETGAQRDTRDGKGRYDLISPLAIRRLAERLEFGAKHYGDRNWEKGMPLGRILDSALRHIFQHLEGCLEEDHLGAALCNLMFACHIDTAINRGLLPDDLDDLGSVPMTEARAIAKEISKKLGINERDQDEYCSRRTCI